MIGAMLARIKAASVNPGMSDDEPFDLTADERRH